MPFDDKPNDIEQLIVQLIWQAQQGDAKARERLHELHWPQIYRLAQRQLGDRRPAANSASDFVQETMSKADRKLDQFHGKSAGEYHAWLGTICTNTIRGAVRHAGADRRAEDKTEPLEEDGMLAEQPSTSALVAGRQSWVMLMRAMAKLPDKRRQAVCWRHLEGYSLAEIAERLEVSELAAASHISRGLAALREILGHGPLDPAGPDGKVHAPPAKLDQAIAEYLRRADQGRPVDLAAFVAEHADCGSSLRARLEWIEQVQAMLKDPLGQAPIARE